MKSAFPVLLLILWMVKPLVADVDFANDVAPLLAEKCLDCHNDREPKGALDLSTKKSAFAGGDSGVVITPGKLQESYLWERVAANEMPPKHPLSDAEKQLLQKWIEEGAKWSLEKIDPFAFTTSARAGYDWWSLKPLAKVQPPGLQPGENPVDAFIRAKRNEHGLTASSPADPRILMRRLSFSLLGMPPSFPEVEDFVANPTEEAYSAVVDRMLASPQYGERWGRHWLDLARFGESHGFERDKLRDNAWPYRDWVIQALNADMPYDEFARQQIAGDVLYPGDSNALIATGFLVAGPYDDVGQSQQSAAMRAVVRQDEMEDYIGTVCQTFLGLTANCARCHSHKFDPISQTEYYQIAAALAGVRPGERPYQTKELEQKRTAAEKHLAEVRTNIDNLLTPLREQLKKELQREDGREVKNAVAPIARWTFENDANDDMGSLHGTLHGGATISDGQLHLNGKDAYLSTAPLASQLRAKTLEAWVRLDDLTQRGGGVLSVQTTDGGVFDAIVYGERDAGQWMAGSNGFVRWNSFKRSEEKEANKSLVHVAIVYREDGTIQGYRNGEPYGLPYKSSGLVTYEPGSSQVLLGLRHGTGPGGNRMLTGHIEQAQLYDKALTDEEIGLTSARFNIVSKAQLLARMSEDQRSQLAKWEAEAKALSDEIGQLQNLRVYAVAPQKPAATHVLLRGDAASPAEEVNAGGIQAIQGLSANFNLTTDASDAERRRKFAEWMTSQENPIFARVIVNRIWHYHFGTGIVASPNDFGFNGIRPTHPELLDFLANYLVEHDGSLKAVHKLIVTSETFCQSSRPRPEAMAADAGNQWLWRYAPQRLEAEVVRDTMLQVTGALNPQYGGPSYRNFETFNRNSQFYIMQDRVEPEYHRRTIYRMWVRSGRNQLLDALDCPDPSVTTPDRAVTTTPTQSLSLLNNSFVLRMADLLAGRAAEGNDSTSAQVERMYELALQRQPRSEELEPAVRFVEGHGLPALARVLFNTNEFLFAE
ncbi:MAG: DUF1553 domain-containing protein [Planctomycetaceae bacterium]|nr:DUF1553 domain-containing protein [Planctomycetaceae bacterium]